MLTLFKQLAAKFGKHPETKKQVAKSYQRPVSISEKLPWMEYDTESQCFLLDDGRSVAAVFELSDVASEARPDQYLEQLQIGLQGVFQDVFPMYFDSESPWIVQFFVQDELSLKNFMQQCQDYVKPLAKNTEFSDHYLELVQAHTELLTRPQGLFVDNKVSGIVFRGKRRRVRMVIYRRLHGHSKLRRGRSAIQDLNTVAQTLIAKLEGCGVRVARYSGREFYNWLLPWFNPNPKMFQKKYQNKNQLQNNLCPQCLQPTPPLPLAGEGWGEGAAESAADLLLERCPYPGDGQMPFGYDFSEKLFYSVPESDHAKGVWYFDNKPHKYVNILGITSLPKIGHISAERSFGNYWFSLVDKMPAGSVLQITVVIQSQEAVKNHIFAIENSTKRASSTEAEMTREDCAVAKRAIESGNYFFPSVMGVYLRGDTLDDLYDKETEIETLLASNGFQLLNGDYELTPVDSYLRYLPMCYSYEFDKARLLRSRYLSGVQLSKLLPLYGRERGTEHPAITLYNRGGEPLTLDPFNPADKDFNSHLLLLGTTGAGKSALCVYLMMQLMAFYRPRLVIIDAGNSFGLLSEYFKTQGLTVNRVEISFNKPTSLNPFAESKKMLIQLRANEAQQQLSVTLEDEENALDKEIETRIEFATQTEMAADEENRDYMGEIALAAQLMITGGEKREEEAITRQDRYWILKAVVEAAKIADHQGRDQMIATDVINAFHYLAEQLEQENKLSDRDIIIRLKKMAENMSLFCQDNLSSQYFNVPGKPWPEADITILEMGLFKDAGYEAQRALAFMGAMNKTISLAEQHQYEERFTVFFADECHVVTSNPLTAVSVTKCSKMSRKIGLWLWFATQNVQDFPNDARKMLSMMEFWICLGMSEAELDEVERFKALTDEEKTLFRSVRKEAKKYVEGVILCNKFKGLFRNIPPRLSLALAMTEQTEKAERQKIMQQYHCSEVEAAMCIADQMIQIKNN
jgi:conjugative transfer ATPase